jgi:uncharacterized protein
LVNPGRIVVALLPLALAGIFALLAFGGPGGGAPPPATAAKPAETLLAMPARLAPPKPVTAAIPPPAPLAAAAPEPAAAPIAALPPPPAPPKRDQSSAQPLLPAPDPALVETGPQGPLPIIGRDGRQPWRVYGRPFDRADGRPRIAIVITGLGLSGDATQAAIDSLPGAVTLAFDPYGQALGDWVNRARAAGHEVLLGLPMEPVDYPRQDPGPYTLLTSLSPDENRERLDWVLSRVSGYVGVTTMMGSRFTTSQTSLLPIMDELKKRGLMFVDGRASEQSVAGALAETMGVPRVIADDTIDADTARDAIDRHLASLETMAQQSGRALGIGFAYPVTLERIALWAKTLDQKGIALAPASALPALPGDAKGAAK